MSATATSTNNNEIETWRLLGHMARGVIARNVDGLTHEESLMQPQPGGNCLNWVMGHLTVVYDKTLPMLGQESVLPKDVWQLYDRGTPPLQDGTKAMPFNELLQAWNDACQRFDTGLSTLNAERLDQKAPASPTNNPNETIRSLLTTIGWHQAYHAGQTAILRRLAGKEGAIR